MLSDVRDDLPTSQTPEFEPIEAKPQSVEILFWDNQGQYPRRRL